MSGRWASGLGRLVGVLVLVASGAYLLVYLWRWEWNRALVAGSFFVAAEVALATVTVLGRLRALERRLDAAAGGGPAPGAVPVVRDRIREAAPPPPAPFAWLEGSVRSTNVFVPVLLGAGVVVSVLAAGIERLASATAVPAMEARLAHRLRHLALPEGGLLGAPPATPGGALGPLDHRRARRDRVVLGGFAVLAGAVLLAAAIDVLADGTQDRPDPTVPGSMAVTVELAWRRADRDAGRTAEALFVACRHTIGDGSRAAVLTVPGVPVVTLVVTPAFGEHAQRRFVGCLEDANFDRVSAAVVAVDHLDRP